MMCLARVVDLVDDRRQRRRFTAPGYPGHHHQPPFGLAETVDDLRKLQLIDSEDFDGNQTENGRHPVHLEKNIDTESGVFIKRIDEVQLFFFYQFRKTGPQKLFGKKKGIVFGKYLVRKRDDLSVDPCPHNRIGLDVQIASPRIDHAAQIAPDLLQDLKTHLGGVQILLFSLDTHRFTPVWIISRQMLL